MTDLDIQVARGPEDKHADHLAYLRERYQKHKDEGYDMGMNHYANRIKDWESFILKHSKQWRDTDKTENIHAAQGSAAGVSKAFADIEQSKSQPKK